MAISSQPPQVAVEGVGSEQTLMELLRLLRPRQWVKNAFVLAPLFFTPSALSWGSLASTLLGALGFCLLSSAIYVVNDWRDREADRWHPSKRHRPLARGTVTVREALLLAAALTLSSGAIAAMLPATFGTVLLLYLALNLAYSFGLKQVAILDVMIIAIGFVLRIEAGATLIAVEPTVWIVVCTGLLALFLAIGKRRDDLVQAVGDRHRRALSGYNRRFLESAQTMTLGALLVSYTVYTTDTAVMSRLGTGQLYLSVPFVLAGGLRYLQITLVEERSGSPTAIVTEDPFIIVAVLGWLLTFLALIYL